MKTLELFKQKKKPGSEYLKERYELEKQVYRDTKLELAQTLEKVRQLESKLELISVTGHAFREAIEQAEAKERKEA